MRLHGIEKNDVKVRGRNMKQKNHRLRATGGAHTTPWTLWRIFIRRGSDVPCAPGHDKKILFLAIFCQDPILTWDFYTVYPSY